MAAYGLSFARGAQPAWADRTAGFRGGSLGVSRTLQGAIPQVAFQRLVGEAMRMTAQHLAEATTSRRLALLVTVTLHLGGAVLTDAALSMFDKLMGSPIAPRGAAAARSRPRARPETCGRGCVYLPVVAARSSWRETPMVTWKRRSNSTWDGDVLSAS